MRFWSDSIASLTHRVMFSLLRERAVSMSSSSGVN